MKARVIATGDIVEVMFSHTNKDKGYDVYVTPQGACFSKEKLEFIDTGESLDYWTRLEHQAAIAAMQGIVENKIVTYSTNEICTMAEAIAHALVEKYKKEK